MLPQEEAAGTAMLVSGWLVVMNCSWPDVSGAVCRRRNESRD